jgi:hypothetical protein
VTREMNERFMNMLDEHHQKNAFVQVDGSIICRGCKEAWPCDMRQVLDAFTDMGKVLEIVSVLNMKAYGLVSELTEALDGAQPPVQDTERERVAQLLVDAKEFLAVGVPG